MCTEKEEINEKITLEFINGNLSLQDYRSHLIADDLVEVSPVRSFTKDIAATALSKVMDRFRPVQNEDPEEVACDQIK